MIKCNLSTVLSDNYSKLSLVKLLHHKYYYTQLAGWAFLKGHTKSQGSKIRHGKRKKMFCYTNLYTCIDFV